VAAWIFLMQKGAIQNAEGAIQNAEGAIQNAE
jgi:hypothetical protein